PPRDNPHPTPRVPPAPAPPGAVAGVGGRRADGVDAALRPVGPTGTPRSRTAAARLLARADWRPGPDQVLFTGNGRQAISAAVAALVPPGGRLGAEELTYPVLRSLADRLGVTVVPLAVDGDGVRPDALAAVHRTAPLHAVYVQPTLHNPLSLTMPPGRRADLAETLRRLDVPAIEDTVWAFLHDDLPPFAALAPERTIVVDSLSKRLAPGLTVGFAVVPDALVPTFEAVVRSGGWPPSGYALEAATRWQSDGTVDALARAKRREIGHRQSLVRRALSGFALRTDPRSCFCWWDLPPAWRADLFVAAASRRGIAVTPAAAFAADPRRTPHAVRLGLASPPRETLDRALRTLAALARSAPDAQLPA
ncbi:PLP-dependent aminotransferase family protein, partial [Streptomyces sp. Act-28]